MHGNRTLIRGDNLEVMREFPDESVDLIATRFLIWRFPRCKYMKFKTISAVFCRNYHLARELCCKLDLTIRGGNHTKNGSFNN